MALSSPEHPEAARGGGGGDLTSSWENLYLPPSALPAWSRLLQTLHRRDRAGRSHLMPVGLGVCRCHTPCDRHVGTVSGGSSCHPQTCGGTIHVRGLSCP